MMTLRVCKGFRGGAAFLYLGEKTSGLASCHGAAPEKSSLEKAKDKAMFQGMTIEELIRSVERAEQHAREQQSTSPAFYDNPVRRMESREWIEVA
jgi:hypothetical protein